MGQYKLFFDEVIFMYHRKKGNYYLCIILAIWSHFDFRSAIKVKTRTLPSDILSTCGCLEHFRHHRELYWIALDWTYPHVEDLRGR